MRKKSKDGQEYDARRMAQAILTQKELDGDYSKREIDNLIEASDERASSNHKQLMQRMDTFELNSKVQWTRIESQTTKTNGYVADLIRWKWIFVGFGTCITVIVLPTLWALIQAGKF